MSGEERRIAAAEARRRLQTGEAVLVDVREADEYRREHIAGALSLPLAFVKDGLPKGLTAGGRTVIFQCQKGGRGNAACVAVGDDSDVRNLEGGIEAWKAAGLPVVGSGGARISVMRQVQIIIGSLVAAGTGAGFLGYPFGFAVAGVFGAALAMAGMTGWCGLALLLSKAPWNR